MQENVCFFGKVRMNDLTFLQNDSHVFFKKNSFHDFSQQMLEPFTLFLVIDVDIFFGYLHCSLSFQSY